MGSTEKNIYFLSDFHLGVPTFEKSLLREKEIVNFLRWAEPKASEIIMVGDVFDFWFEYKTVVPKGYIRLLGEIARMSDAGIKFSLFTGNHDMWMFDYLEKELGVTIFRKPIERILHGKSFYIGHGDGLGPGDHGYKFIKKVFSNKLCQWLFKWIHPDLGIGLANYLSRSSRASTGSSDEIWLGKENEWLVQYCSELLKTKNYQFMVFGHRHLPIEFHYKKENATYLNLGDWIKYYTFAVLENGEFKLKKWLGNTDEDFQAINLR